MKLKFIDSMDETRKAKKKEQMEMLVLLIVIVIGLLITFASMVDRFMDFSLSGAGIK